MMLRGKFDSAIYGSSQPFLQWFQPSGKVGVNNTTVFSPINGYSKNRTPRDYFPRRNSGQTLMKNFLKSGQVISAHSV